MSDPAVHSTLVAARNRVARRWAPSPIGDDCAGLAIAAVAPTTRSAAGALRLLARSAGLRVWRLRPACILVLFVGRWNDRQLSVRTVLAAFDRAIAATAPEPDTSFLADVAEREGQPA
jgi:hypothetical protein